MTLWLSRSTSAFTHDALELGRDSIRTFRIDRPPDLSSKIYLTLQHHAIEAQEYACLSYAWGPAVNDQTIYVRHTTQGRYKRYRIHENLFCFLRIARLVKYKGSLWADAICIDQTSTLERNHQVQRMAFIFKTASSVLIWPGLVYYDTTKGAYSRPPDPIEHLDRVKTDGILNRAYGHFPRGSMGQFSTGTSAFHAPSALINAPYFKRSWVIQEMFLAQDLRLVVGCETIDFWEFAQIYRKHTVRPTREPKADSFTREPDQPPSQLDLYSNFCSKPDSGRQSMSLARCMELSQRTQCSDPRDRVYSMIGLCADLTDLPIQYQTDEHGLLVNICCQVRPPSLSGLVVLIANVLVAVDAKPIFLCNAHMSSHFDMMLRPQTDESPGRAEQSVSVGNPAPPGFISAVHSTPPTEVGFMTKGYFLLLGKHSYDIQAFQECHKCRLLQVRARDCRIDWDSSTRLGEHELVLCATIDGHSFPDVQHYKNSMKNRSHLFKWPPGMDA